MAKFRYWRNLVGTLRNWGYIEGMKMKSENKIQGEPVDQALEGVRHLNKLILESAEGGITHIM